jgi:pyrimidine oxygenase
LEDFHDASVLKTMSADMQRAVEFGIFMPVASNGFLFSRNAPRYHPTFDHHRRIARLAEDIGIDYLFWMGKWKGFGGETGYWEQSLEPMTMVSAIAATTSRIKLLATINPILFHPAVAAKIITTIHDVSDGRFGVNVVTGNTLDEIEQMGVVPEGYKEWRYDYADEWMRIVRMLWRDSSVSIQGRFFNLTNCVSAPKPSPSRMPAIVSAGTSDDGLRFAARHSELIFIGMRPPLIAKARQFAAEEGRTLKVSTNAFVVARATDAEAEAEYAHIQAGVDQEALDNVRGSFDRDARESTKARTAYLREPAPVGFGMGAPIVGSPATVARKLAVLIVDHGFDGVQFTFIDYLKDLSAFQREVVPFLLPILNEAGLETGLGSGPAKTELLENKLGVSA